MSCPSPPTTVHCLLHLIHIASHFILSPPRKIHDYNNNIVASSLSICRSHPPTHLIYINLNLLVSLTDMTRLDAIHCLPFAGPGSGTLFLLFVLKFVQRNLRLIPSTTLPPYSFRGLLPHQPPPQPLFCRLPMMVLFPISGVC